MIETLTATARGTALNPFSTRYHAPGTVGFFFEKDKGAESARGLFDTFAASGYRGEIVGPHGTGKTTLLRALEREARTQGCAVQTITLRDDGKAFSILDFRFSIQQPQQRPEFPVVRSFENPKSKIENAFLIVDGAEQLSAAAWWLLRLRCRLRAVGLLVTTHRPLGLPVLYRTSVDADLARRIARNVIEACPRAPRLTEDRDVDAALAEAQGDMRETLFKLYDLYERRWSTAPVTSLPS